MNPDQREQIAWERIDALVRDGLLPREAVERAEQLFRATLAFDHGVVMPNGERAYLQPKDLYHILEDHRIWRKPWRIQRLLEGVIELRTAREGRRVAFSRWRENGEEVVGYAILTPDGEVLTLHLTSEKRLARMRQQGAVLWP